MQSTADTLRRTPLHDRHERAGAKLVSFAGWEMPLEYSTGLSEEHIAVRTRAGLFDVTHMGQVELAGKDALAAVQWFSSNDASRLKIGQAHYSALTTAAGTFVMCRFSRRWWMCRKYHTSFGMSSGRSRSEGNRIG